MSENDSQNTSTSDLLASIFPPMWQDGIPPYCEYYALQAVSVARSYWNARHNGRQFVYSGGETFLNSHDHYVNDDSGAAKIDCSTYMHLVLRGIRYQDSPYANETPEYVFDPEQLDTVTRCRWGDSTLAGSATLANAHWNGGSVDRMMVRYADELAAYYWAAGRVFYPENEMNLRPGDLIFYGNDPTSDPSRNKFMKIHHVGMIGTARQPKTYYNVSTGDGVVYISQIHSSDTSGNREIAFYARPDYARIHQGIRADGNYLEAPWTLGESTSQSRNVIVSPNSADGTIWTGTEVGRSASGNRVIKLADENNELILTAGTYRLSGAPVHADRRSKLGNYYWGVRLSRGDSEMITYTGYGYDPSTSSGDIISGTITKDHIWDIGFGAEFSLSSTVFMRADIYISQYPSATGVPYSNTDPSVDNWKPCLVKISNPDMSDTII